MATKAELARLDRLLADQEAIIRDAFLRFVRDMKSPEMVAEITRYLERGDTAGALTLMDSHIRAMGTAIPQVMSNVGNVTALELSGLVPSLIAVSFDVSYPRAAELIRRNTFEYVQNFTNEQRAVAREAISQAYMDGSGTVAMARRFRDHVGLTSYQNKAVDNYRTLLENGSREANDRALRSRRYDQAVDRVADGGKPMTPEQIDRAVEAYRRNFLQMRAETIARTEGVEATSLARREAVRQMSDQSGISLDRVRRFWNATGDDHTREWHASMQDQERGFEEPFEDGLGNLLMYPGDKSAPAETIINCRCVETYGIS